MANKQKRKSLSKQKKVNRTGKMLLFHIINKYKAMITHRMLSHMKSEL